MDINENLQQINTFVGGMNTDTSDSLLQDKLYRFARNLRITTNKDNNSGELHFIEGTTLHEDIFDDFPYTFDEIFAATTIREYGIILVRTYIGDQWNGDKGYEWGIIRFTDKASSAKLLFGMCKEHIWNDEKDKISLLTRFESDKNIKLYIADGIHEIMSLNIADVPVNPSTNIKTLTGYTAVSLPPLEVKVSTSSGLLKPTRVQYAYRLYSNKGAVTKLSALSRPLSLYKTKNSGYANTEKTGRSINIKIPSITLSTSDSIVLDHIQLFRITYVENGQTPEIVLIKDQKYSENDSILDTGGTDIQTVGISEFLSYVNLGVIPKLIESKNDYLFAANIKYKQDETDELFSNINVETTTNTETHMSGTGTYFTWEIVFGEEYGLNQSQQSNNFIDQHTSYRPGETYRFGVILYDKEGNASSVKHIQDIEIKIPHSNISLCGNFSNDKKTYILDIGVKPINIKFKRTDAEIPKCSRYEIVRCIRTLNDKKTITQGIVGRPLLYHKGYYAGLSTFEPTNKLCPSGFMTLDRMVVYSPHDKGVSCIPAKDIIQFASPEIVYQPDDMKDILNANSNNIKLEIVENYSVPTKYKKHEDSTYVRVMSDNFTEMSLRFKLINDATATNKIVPRFDSECGEYNRDAEGDKLLPFKKNDKTGYISFNYITPYAINSFVLKQWNITNIAYPIVPEYNTFSSNESIRFLDDITQISNYQYIGWSAPLMLDVPTGQSSDLYDSYKNYGLNERMDHISSRFYYGLGTTGACVLLKTNEDIGNFYQTFKSNIQTSDVGTGLFSITVANITKLATPYGGNDQNAIKNSVYYSFGDNFANNTEEHVLNSGDCYVRLFQYNALHNWYDATFVCPTKMGTVYSVPIITDIDLQGQFGHTFNSTDNKAYYIQDKAASFDGYVQDKDAYLYNTAYNVHPDIIGYTPYNKEERDSSIYDVRVHYSEQKTNGESFDSWLQFKGANFLDVDSRYGEITDIRLFKDKLIFWQNNATGLLAVNERVVLQDASATLVVLGTGSVLERYDYFTTTYGMKSNQQADTLSNESLYWWDGYRKEILLYTDKYLVTPLTTTKFVKNYINSLNESKNPTIFYDPNNKEIVCNCVNNESIVYSEQIQNFSSVYDIAANFLINLRDDIDLHVCDEKNIYWYNRNITDKKPSKSEIFGNEIYPYLQYVVNKNNTYNKTFDIQIIGGRFYGGDDMSYLQMTYKTPLKQEGRADGKCITNREYDFRLNIPRNGKEITVGGQTKWITNEYGDRLRGKTMQCELWSTNNSIDFSLQYIITKYRMSWS